MGLLDMGLPHKATSPSFFPGDYPSAELPGPTSIRMTESHHKQLSGKQENKVSVWALLIEGSCLILG